MKTILALASSLLIAGSALAQEGGGSLPMESSTGSRHMFEFNADSALLGVLSFDKSKTRGQSADNDTSWNLALNYAYSLPQMPKLQIGGRLAYLNDVNASGDIESYGAQIGVIYNLSERLENSVYASLYGGMLWENDFTAGATDDEVRIGTFAIGKRFSLERWGIKYLTYSPEVALQMRNSTTNRATSSFDYTQDLQIRFLQFSVLF